MSRADLSSLRARSVSHELTSLEERLGLLLLVRLAVVMLVVIAAGTAQASVGFNVEQIGPVSAGYLAAAAAAEWYRRTQQRGRMSVHRLILPLDAVYLAIACAPSGGPRSPLIVLFAVQLIAVTLLASQRAGLRMALWDSFLFVLIPALSLAGHIGSLLGVSRVPNPPATQTTLAIVGFWVVAICTAVFSSVSERELRRSKAEMGALAEMASELEAVVSEEEILAILLRTVVTSFGFRRGALWCTLLARPVGLLMPSGDAAVVNTPVPPLARGDRVADTAWEAREAVLLKQLSVDDDPVANGMLPGAVNVVALPIQVEGDDSGLLLLEHGGNTLTARLPKRTLVMLAQFTAHAALVLRNARLTAEREKLASMDGLTGLANRREFDRVLSSEVNRSERSKEPLSLVVFDLDHFKQVNDSRGHLAGDEVLRAIGQVLSAAVREMDLVARYGGEEFAIVLPRCDQHDAVRVVERIRKASDSHDVLDGVTLSAGIATLPFNAADGLSLVAAADEALYESKRAGRDRYTISARRVDRLGWLGSCG